MKDLKDLPSILSVSDVQKFLGIGRVQAYNLCSGSSFHIVRVGNRILIAKEIFINWLYGNQASPQS